MGQTLLSEIDDPKASALVKIGVISGTGFSPTSSLPRGLLQK